MVGNKAVILFPLAIGFDTEDNKALIQFPGQWQLAISALVANHKTKEAAFGVKVHNAD